MNILTYKPLSDKNLSKYEENNRKFRVKLLIRPFCSAVRYDPFLDIIGKKPIFIQIVSYRLSKFWDRIESYRENSKSKKKKSDFYRIVIKNIVSSSLKYRIVSDRIQKKIYRIESDRI